MLLLILLVEHTDEPLLAMLGDVRGKRVLDVGSGNGYLCRKLATQGGAARVVGVDICDGFVDMALKRCARSCVIASLTAFARTVLLASRPSCLSLVFGF